MEPLAFAEAVENQQKITKVQIPLGLVGGDSFIVTPDNGRIFTVVVPEGAQGGSFIQVIVPDDQNTSDLQQPFVKLSKATVGAAVLGGVVGTLILGPICGVILAGGAAYATTRQHGRIGETSRNAGNSTFRGLSATKRWIENRVLKRTNKSGGSMETPVATPIL
jgi:hypothetical protein